MKNNSPRYRRHRASRAFRLKPGFITSCLGAALLLNAAGCLKRGVTPIRTHFNRGVYHYSHGDYQTAISEYRLAVEEHAGDHRALFNLAEALESMATSFERDGHSEQAEGPRLEAEEHYRKLLAADPGHLRASVNLAAREMHNGDRAAAEARLRAAIEQHARSVLPRVALAAHHLATGEEASIRAAAELLEEAVGHDRTHPDANVLLGHAYAALERHGAADPDLVDRARRAYQQALDHAPADVGALIGLARLERRAGKPERAESLARRALYVLPDLLEAHLMLAELLAAAGELEEATAHLWRGRQLEDAAHARLSPEEYRWRLLDLYRRLARQEGAGPSP